MCICRFDSLLTVFAFLVSDSTGGLTSRLTGRLTFTATAFDNAFFELRRIERIDMFQGLFTTNFTSLSQLLYDYKQKI
jgi:hypothetical protein